MKLVKMLSLIAFSASLMASGMTLLGSSSAGASKSPILIGYVGDLTGPGASDEADGLNGAEARIDLQNAHGGVNGHRLKLVSTDTATSPSQASTAVSDLVSAQHVFGIIEGSAIFFLGAKIAQQAGVPVVGYGIDGPEWLNQPYSNMFDVLPTPAIGAVNGVTYTSTAEPQFIKSRGITKLGVFTYAISPSAVHSVESEVYAAKQLGLSVCDEDLSVPFGSTDFTAAVLQMKADGCNGYSTTFATASDVGMAQAVKNAGLSMKGEILSEAYANGVLDNTEARAAVDGDYVGAQINFSTPNAAVKSMLATIKKYDPAFHGIPDLGLWSGYVSADAMILGLQRAGTDPTQSSFIKNLRKVTDYTAGGILPEPTTFAHFGTAQMLGKSANCIVYVRLQGSKYVPVNGGTPVCGKLITVPSSALTS